METVIIYNDKRKVLHSIVRHGHATTRLYYKRDYGSRAL